jgi:hypothetical protein
MKNSTIILIVAALAAAYFIFTRTRKATDEELKNIVSEALSYVRDAHTQYADQTPLEQQVEDATHFARLWNDQKYSLQTIRQKLITLFT